MHTLLAYLALFTFVLGLGSLVIVATTLGVPVRPDGFLERVPRIVCRATLRAAGVRLVINNAHNIAHGEPRIYIANHVSWFDVFALASIVPRYRFVAKKELSKLPVFGRAAGKVAAVYIDRQNRKAAFDAYREAAEQVRGGISVVVFPEGTRGTSYALRPFKKGPFVLAIAAQAPVVPVLVHGTREVQAKGGVRIRPGVAELTFLEPIPTAGMSYGERDALMQTVWVRMAEEMERRYAIHSDGSAIDMSSRAE